MTTVVANSSGRKSAKDKKANPNKTPVSPPTSVTANNVSESISNNQTEDLARAKSDKFQPTAEQMRIASLMSDKKDENDLKPKIEQIVELTGATKEDAAVALYDCDNDMAKAIEMILDGDSLDSEWQSTGRKKKTKVQIASQPVVESLTNGNKKNDKPSRLSQKNNVGSNVTPATAKSSRGGGGGGQSSAVNNKVPRGKKDGRGIGGDSKPDAAGTAAEENDIFAKASTNLSTSGAGDSAVRRGGGIRRGGPRNRGTGLPRGGGGRGGGPGGAGPGGRGSRTFMNRGLQGSNSSNNNNDGGFPNSIETWSNSTAEQAKNDDLNTMTVGNWSDIAANEDWSEEDWTSQPMETKVFTPSTKTIPEQDELVAEQTKSAPNNNASQANQQLSFISPNKNEDNSQPQPTMSAILSGSIKRTSAAATPGQALLQQIQQQSSAPQNSNLNQYNLSQYSKQATESIKSLVGLSSNNMIPNDLISANDHQLDNNLAQIPKQPPQQQQQQPQSHPQQQSNQQQNRLNKVQNQRSSKIPETAVEMPSNDPISNLAVHFGTLEFGANNFSLGSTDSNLFESVTQNANSKPDNKNLNLLSSGADASSNANSNYRSANSNVQQGGNNNKSMLQNSVLGQGLNDSILSADHRNDKSLNSNNYSNKQQMDRKNEYINMSYKPSYASNENTYSTYQAGSVPASNVGYYSSATQSVTPFGNSNQSLMANTANAYNSTYNNNAASANANNAQNVSKIRDIDNSTSQQQVAASSASAANNNKPYDAASSVGGTSLSLMSNSTVTTNVLKNTLSASKGIHSVPPGVQQQQPTQMMSTPAPYIMGNTGGMPIPYPYPYDMQFQTPRDHGYPYAAADVKYSRGNESDMLPVSSQAAGAVQTATQAHNQAYMNTYPPGYGLYFAGVNFAAHQGFYGTAQHPAALYPVQAQTTASAGSAFAKPNTAANYGSHSYNSGYDSLGTVTQPQDYVNKSYPQQLQQHKQMGANNAADLSANNQQSMYGGGGNKGHSQMNKTYEKQGGFQQQSTQFNLSNSAQNTNLGSYGAPYLLPQQAMHQHLASNEPTQQQQQSGVGNQRSLSQTHKGSSSNQSYGKFNWN